MHILIKIDGEMDFSCVFALSCDYARRRRRLNSELDERREVRIAEDKDRSRFRTPHFFTLRRK